MFDGQEREGHGCRILARQMDFKDLHKLTMTLIEHVPSFVSGYDPKEFEFNSLDELFKLNTLKKFMDDLWFHKFSVQKECTSFDEIEFHYFPKFRYTLMAEYNNGYKWWVVGYIVTEGESEVLDKLPKWVAKKEPQHIET